MTEKDPVVARDEEELKELDKEISDARRHFREETHEGEHHFYDEGTELTENVDNNISPPG
jgi:hypothetical protein